MDDMDQVPEVGLDRLVVSVHRRHGSCGDVPVHVHGHCQRSQSSDSGFLTDPDGTSTDSGISMGAASNLYGSDEIGFYGSEMPCDLSVSEEFLIAGILKPELNPCYRASQSSVVSRTNTSMIAEEEEEEEVAGEVETPDADTGAIYIHCPPSPVDLCDKSSSPGAGKSKDCTCKKPEPKKPLHKRGFLWRRNTNKASSHLETNQNATSQSGESGTASHVCSGSTDASQGETKSVVSKPTSLHVQFSQDEQTQLSLPPSNQSKVDSHCRGDRHMNLMHPDLSPIQDESPDAIDTVRNEENSPNHENCQSNESGAKLSPSEPMSSCSPSSLPHSMSVPDSILVSPERRALRRARASPKQSWLLRLFESKLFDMSIAIQYLFNSKEPGVQTYLGTNANKISST